MLLILRYYFIIDHNMPPKKYTMDELEKKNLMRNSVSDLRKEIMNKVKAILNEKDKEIEDLKSQVTLLQNHVKHALDKKS